MGGNALKNTTTRRYDADEYHALVMDVHDRLHAIMKKSPSHKISEIPAYRNKPSFGDMDIVYSVSPNFDVSESELRKHFGSNEVVKNGSVISFDYKELQIDIIRVPFESHDYAVSYFSWNDLGNLVGRLAHKFGLKHGHWGLFLPIRFGTNKVTDLLLTTDIRETMQFLGLDHDRFRQGFDELEDIFEFVASSPHYNPSFYLLENLNTIAKTRDRKRSTYRAFLEWGEKQTGAFATMDPNKEIYLPMILDAFPNAIPEFAKIMKDRAVYMAAREKFNGDVVSALTGLQNKQLGEFMVYLKQKHTMFSNAMVSYMHTDTVERMIKESFLVFRNERGENMNFRDTMMSHDNEVAKC